MTADAPWRAAKPARSPSRATRSGPAIGRTPRQRRIAFRNGAWLSGDIGFVDDHDHLHIIDRKKDVIISGGFNIYPIEVEDVLYKRDDDVRYAP